MANGRFKKNVKRGLEGGGIVVQAPISNQQETVYFILMSVAVCHVLTDSFYGFRRRRNVRRRAYR